MIHEEEFVPVGSGDPNETSVDHGDGSLIGANDRHLPLAYREVIVALAGTDELDVAQVEERRFPVEHVGERSPVGNETLRHQ